MDRAGVDRADFRCDRNIVPLKVQSVQMRALNARRDVIEPVVDADHRFAAAEAHVAADRVPEAFGVFVQHGKRAVFAVDGVEIDVLVKTDISALRRRQNQRFSDRLDALRIEARILMEEVDFAGAAVQNAELRMREIAARGVAVTEKIDKIPDRFDRIDSEKRLRDALDLRCVRRHEEQRGAALVDDAGAVHPVRKLVEHLVIGVVRITLLHLFAVFLVHGIIIRRICVDRAEYGIRAVRELFDPRRRKRQRECMQRFAAGKIQPIIACELLLLFGAFLLVFGPHGGKQNRLFVLPEIPVLLAEIGQLPELAVIEPETALVAVLLLVAPGYDKRSFLSVRRIPDIGQKTILQKVFDLYGFHGVPPDVNRNIVIGILRKSKKKGAAAPFDYPSCLVTAR